ncbi:MAG: DUF1697 domain-containing protein [Vicinamibacteria bacterium]|nr:DUF1697 domain-containing protein [Vicinamibacteria bacterium]
MARHVAFLRAINVGGSHVVKMGALKAMFEDLGFEKVETFIASGNVIFETPSRDLGAVERRIEPFLEKALGHEVATFVRSLEDVAAIARYQPFPAAAMASAVSLSVGLLKEPLPKAARAALLKLRTDIDDFHVNGSELYWICLSRQSESRISNAVFERALKVKATFRGRRTMERLAAKYPA